MRQEHKRSVNLPGLGKVDTVATLLAYKKTIDKWCATHTDADVEGMTAEQIKDMTEAMITASTRYIKTGKLPKDN